jgi:hypothetical protein
MADPTKKELRDHDTGALHPLVAASPPPLLTESNRKSGSMRQLLAALLSLCLGLFLADAVVSLLDDSLIVFLGVHGLTGIRVIVGLFALLVAILVYGLMGLTPAIPKRLFLPLTLFYLATQLAIVPFLIFCFGWLQQVAWAFSLGQVLLGLWILCRVQGGLKFGWPLVSMAQLGDWRFSWRNLTGFVLANIFGLLPAVFVYLAVCTAVGVDHFSDGFMKLRPGGFLVKVRKYVRDDGKTIQLFPMSHVAEADFYQRISLTFPTNSIILMEGVTDDKHLLKHKINYERMARALGLAEQHEKFAPTRGKIVPADIDVDQFSTNTLDLLNLVILVHTQGVNPGTLQKLLQFTPSPVLEERLLDDLLNKRNQHLWEEIQSHLPQSEHIIVPWGVAHMPWIAMEIQKAGFHLEETQEYTVIRFHGKGDQAKSARP